MTPLGATTMVVALFIYMLSSHHATPQPARRDTDSHPRLRLFPCFHTDSLSPADIAGSTYRADLDHQPNKSDYRGSIHALANYSSNSKCGGMF